MILASGFIDPKERSQMEENGIHLFVQKPYHMEEILMSIRDILDGKKS